MQFAVPQFTDVEDKIIGPLTIKQFLVLVAAGGLCLMFWSLPLPKIFAILIDLPIALLGIALAFASYNSRPALSYIFPFVSYMLSPKLMIFKRETNVTQVTPTEVKPIEIKKVAEPEKETGSRLRKLAYLLDQKTAQEHDLLDQSTKADLAPRQTENNKLPKFPDGPKFMEFIKPNKAIKLSNPIVPHKTAQPKTEFTPSSNERSILDD